MDQRRNSYCTGRGVDVNGILFNAQEHFGEDPLDTKSHAEGSFEKEFFAIFAAWKIPLPQHGL